MTGSTRIDALVAEIGSTTTVVSAFSGVRGNDGRPRLLGQGTSLTTVQEGDVTLGVTAARRNLESHVGPLEPLTVLATSSAAGGLRMTVHGLTERMTARAAREAALGAGAVVIYQTAGRMRPHDVKRIVASQPDLILLAGGVEGGDVETVLFNAGQLAAASNWEGGRRPIVVYGGNSTARDEVVAVLTHAGFRTRVTSNVYPAVDRLDVIPARAAIHDAFEEHITHAPGMEQIGCMTTGHILPTPGAVLMAAEALADTVGDLVVVDVGGATTDVHSVTDGSPEVQAMATEPQPHSRRTVEGDLGTFISAPHVAALLPAAQCPSSLPPALPATDLDATSARRLTEVAAVTAVRRHAGVLAHVYTPTGRRTVAEGRDLTACRLLLGTGGALTRLPGGEEILGKTRGHPGDHRLLPPADALCVLDHHYIMAACGALLTQFEAHLVVPLLIDSLELPLSATDRSKQ